MRKKRKIFAKNIKIQIVYEHQCELILKIFANIERKCMVFMGGG